MSRTLSFSAAVREALHQAMGLDEQVIVYGLGVDDPKAIFGTTSGLKDAFGPERVFDMPTSENAMTGVAIGAALNGIRPVMVHQRIDFFLLAMDQLVNNAAKWNYMFNGQGSAAITIRLILGRGWGQGPTHSQNFHSWFAHVPGLKVVMPSTAADAKGLLLQSIFDPNPVLFIEHRWLHQTVGDVPEEAYRIPLGSSRIVRSGADVSLVGMSIMTIEALHAADFLSRHGISCEVVDLRTVKPLDWPTVLGSVNKTGRLLALDNGHESFSVAGEIAARTANECWGKLKCAPQRLGMPDFPESTSPALTRHYHVRAEHIASRVAAMMDRSLPIDGIAAERKNPHDVPGDWFKGPF